MKHFRQRAVQTQFKALYKIGFRQWEKHHVDPSLYEFFKLLKKNSPKPKVLDIGCGNGWISALAAKENIEVWGIDGAKQAIKEAKTNAEKAGVSELTHFVVGNVLDLPYETDFFDGMIDRGLFHHILPSNRKLYFKEILRVLKKESLVHLAVFSKRNPRYIGKTFSLGLVEKIFEKDFKIISKSEDLYPYRTFGHLIYFILERK